MSPKKSISSSSTDSLYSIDLDVSSSDTDSSASLSGHSTPDSLYMHSLSPNTGSRSDSFSSSFSPMSPETKKLLDSLPTPSKVGPLVFSAPFDVEANDFFPSAARVPASPYAHAEDLRSADYLASNIAPRTTDSTSVAKDLLKSPDSSWSELPSSVEFAKGLRGARMPLGDSVFRNFLKSPVSYSAIRSREDHDFAAQLSPISRNLGDDNFLNFLEHGSENSSSVCLHSAQATSSSSFCSLSGLFGSRNTAGSSKSSADFDRKKRKKVRAGLNEGSGAKVQKTRSGREIKPSFKATMR